MLTAPAAPCPILPPTPLSLDHAADLVHTYGSPLYVYHADRLHHTLAQIQQSIAYPRTTFHFAAVVNGNVALLQRIRSAGWGLHGNTPGDLFLGLRAGFQPEDLVYSGSNLSREEMRQALDWGVRTFNWDSLQQVEQFCQVYRDWRGGLGCNGAGDSGEALGREPATAGVTGQTGIRMGVRLNLPDLTGNSRIGVRPAELPRAEALAKAGGLSLGGLHFYRGTGTNATQSFTQAIAPVLAVAQTLENWQYLDFGGGFGYGYRGSGLVFNWSDFGAALTAILGTVPQPIDLLLEPGRAAIAGCASLLTRVIAVKWQGDRQIVGVDTTVGNLAVPSVHGGYRQITTWPRAESRPQDAPVSQLTVFKTDVCGNTTYSRDYLGRNCNLPPLQPGDLLAILDVGAYGYAMSSHFLHRPRPAEVLVQGDRTTLIRQRETYEVLLQHQIFGEMV
ncbi:MAG: hypothetical protein VKK80_03755 [Prochlorothrix sp.]|nr:hypothetical protein [Prochlorothrix sp.]